MQLLNLPKYVSKLDLKKQYHKFAKIYHPDALQGSIQLKEITDHQKRKMEQKFKDLNDANDRLSTWIDERDSNFMN